jgi:hypothetical protein
MMKLLRSMVYGLHMAIGIQPPSEEQATLYVFVWIGIIAFMAAGLALMFYLLG